MPCRSARKRKERSRKYYIRNSDKIKARGRCLYAEDPSKKKAAAASLYELRKEERKASFSNYYHSRKESRMASFSKYYEARKQQKRAYGRAYYRAHKTERNAYDRVYYTANRNTRLRYFRKYHCVTKRVDVRSRYGLAQPTQPVIERYYRSSQANLQDDSAIKTTLIRQFKSQHSAAAANLSRKHLSTTVVRLAAKRLVSRTLQFRRKYVGLLLNSVKKAKSIQLRAQSDFGKGCHTKSTEPYFYEAAYLYIRDSPIPVNEKGEGVVAEEFVGSHTDSDSPEGAGPKGMPSHCASDGSDKMPAPGKKWECSKQCKPLTQFEVDAIVDFKASFSLPEGEVRKALAECDMGCPFGHYTKLVDSTPVDLRGHPIVCYSGDLQCTSVLRILRAASTHFPVLRKFLAHVTTALSAHRALCDIDDALKSGNHQSLIHITGVKSLLSCDVEQNYQKLTPVDCSL